MKENAVVLGFSCGYRRDGPSISDRDLIKKLSKWYHSLFHLPLILQSKLDEAIPENEKGCANIIHVIREHRNKERYLDSDEVANQGIEIAREKGFKTIYILAYTIVHLPYCWFVTRQLAKRYGIKVKPIWVGWIRCDPKSEQWWTRNPLYVVIYSAIGFLFDKRWKIIVKK